MKYYSEETVKNMLKDTRVEILTRNKYGYLENDYRIIRPKVEDYPSIEIPEPHGRLGDLDLLKEDFDASLRATRQLVDLDSDSPFYGLQQRDLANAEKLVNGLIDRTPTVLEASEVKE